MSEQALIVWSERYSIGMRDLDEHHHQMLSIINRLHKFKISNSTSKDVRGLLNEAVDYANRHFEAEESAMRKARYSDMNEHLLAHQRYRKNITRLAHDNGNLSTHLSDTLFRYLKSWWMEHILTMDMQFAASLKNGVAPMKWLW